MAITGTFYGCGVGYRNVSKEHQTQRYDEGPQTARRSQFAGIGGVPRTLGPPGLRPVTQITGPKPVGRFKAALRQPRGSTPGVESCYLLYKTLSADLGL